MPGTPGAAFDGVPSVIDPRGAEAGTEEVDASLVALGPLGNGVEQPAEMKASRARLRIEYLGDIRHLHEPSNDQGETSVVLGGPA